MVASVHEGGQAQHAPAGLADFPLDELPIPVLLARDGALVVANTAARALLDAPVDAPVADVARVLDPRQQLRPLLEAATRAPARLPWPCPGADGAPRALRLDLVPCPSEPGMVIVLLHDEGPQLAMEHELQRRLQFERMLTEASADLIRSDPGALDATINAALARVGRFFGVDRAYVFLIDHAAGTQSNTHEWVEQGISSEAHNLQGVPLDTFPWLLAQLQADHVFRVGHLSELPPEAASEHAEFEREGIQSILIVPLWVGARLAGFAGFDAVRSRVAWDEPYVIGLRLMAQMLASSIEGQRLHLRLREQAFHDALTGLPNRNLLADRHAQLALRLQRDGGNLLVALLDVDDFKQVNDGHGHAVGDRLLCEVGRRLQAAVRDTDTVSRLGGDEFVVLAEGHDAEALAQRLQAACADPVDIEGMPLRCTLSIGLACSARPDDPLDRLLRAADAGLYEAKAAGKDRWVQVLAPVG